MGNRCRTPDTPPQSRLDDATSRLNGINGISGTDRSWTPITIDRSQLGLKILLLFLLFLLLLLLLFVHLSASAGRQLIQPRRQSQRGLANLQLDDGIRTRGIPAGGQVSRVIEMLIHVVAVPRVAFARPDRRATLWGVRIAAGEPHVWRFIESVLLDARDECLEERVDFMGPKMVDFGVVVDDEMVPNLAV